MPCNIYTSTMRYKGDKHSIDITVKSGDKAFAPTWDMVLDIKANPQNEDKYTQEYLKLMRSSYRNNTYVWEEIIKTDELVLKCYCPKDSFCHRYLLVDMLVKCGCKYLGEIT